MHGLFRWSSKWWPGLIPLALFWAIAAWTNTVPMEADLAARSAAVLKDAILDKTRITVDGRDITLAADAFSEDGRRSAVASVDAVPGVRLVNDEARSYLAGLSDQFDVLQITFVDTWAATAAGAFTLTENSLYTREAWGARLGS